MDNIHELRQVCADALRQCMQLEQKAKHIQGTAVQQHQTAMAETQRKYSQMRQQVRNLLQEVYSQTEQARFILSSLRLKPEALTPVAPSNSAFGLDELLRQLYNHRSQVNAAFIRLTASANALKEERRKWWKFW